MFNNKSKYDAAVRANLNWFLNSGVLPDDGRWGVAERILLTAGNSSAEQAIESFPAWSEFDGGYVLEQRRADCCFEVAYYFLLSDETNHRKTAENILNYLYNLSGMLSRNKDISFREEGSWNWSNIRWTPMVWFDDNAWCIMLALKIAEMRPDLDKKYHMKFFALEGAETLWRAFVRQWGNGETDECGELKWSGNLELPHWGALALAALAKASVYTGSEIRQKYLDVCLEYLEYIKKTEFNSSEKSYALIFAAATAEAFEGERKKFIKTGNEIRSKLLAEFDAEYVTFPSKHYEAPNGDHLIDLIYTVNWALVGLHDFEHVSYCPAGRDAIDKIIERLIQIQDDSPCKELNGCWRGMFDARNNDWGGGDLYEGGANSIYSGWTNAPIGWILVKEAGEIGIIANCELAVGIDEDF